MYLATSTFLGGADMRPLSQLLLLCSAARARSAAPAQCVDADPACPDWAKHGECSKNPAYMMQSCARSCRPECGGVGSGPAAAAPQPDRWELEDLTRPYADSAIPDFDGEGLRALAAKRGPDAPVFTWFYAPWCKQCKLVRPAVERAAKDHAQLAADIPPITYAKLDCVADKDAKEFYSVSSYPTFKVLRGKRHRWVEMPRNRSVDAIAAAAAREARGPFLWAHTQAELNAALYEQVPPGTDKMDAPGKGEAAAIALLSSPTGPAARAYAALAAGCSVRLSPMPYIAIADATLLEGAGLSPMQPDEMAIVQLFSEPPEAVPEAEQAVPRVVVRPILAPGSAVAEDGDMDEATEAAACRWALGNRLPLLVDFDEDPYWSKRAGTITFVKMHALLFLSPPHKDLAGVVRRAAARFERGALIIMQFMLADMDASGNAMFKRCVGARGGVWGGCVSLPPQPVAALAYA